MKEKNLQGKTIPVVFSTDANYLIPTYIAVFSMLHNHRDSREIGIVILVPGDFSDAQKAVFRNLRKHFRAFTLRFVNMGDAYRSVPIHLDYVTTPTMYRLLIPDLLKDADKCVYLDSDVVIEGDIADLYDIPLNGSCIAGVREAAADPLAREKLTKLNIPSLEQYVNAGILLMNLREIRKARLQEHLAKAAYDPGYEMNDQDIINVIFWGRIRLIPICWNARWTLIHNNDRASRRVYGKENLRQARRAPAVMHFAGPKKPWHHRHMPAARLWWKYMDMQDRDFRASLKGETALPQKKEASEPLLLRSLRSCTHLLMYLRLYNIVRPALHRPYVFLMKCLHQYPVNNQEDTLFFRLRQEVHAARRAGRRLKCTASAIRHPRKAVWYCPCCRTRLTAFTAGSYPDHPEICNPERYRHVRQDVLCPVCHSLPRHRILASWCDDQKTLLAGSDILYFAAEESMLDWFKKNHISCTTADLLHKADLQLDIQQTGLPEESFDLVLCNHVLEHVDDFRLALAEIFRILRPGGCLICSFPATSSTDLVDEETAPLTAKERIRRFGQADHHRVFGAHADQLLREAGFTTEKIDGSACSRKILPVTGPADYDVNYLFLCRKPVYIR